MTPMWKKSAQGRKCLQSIINSLAFSLEVENLHKGRAFNFCPKQICVKLFISLFILSFSISPYLWLPHHMKKHTIYCIQNVKTSVFFHGRWQESQHENELKRKKGTRWKSLSWGFFNLKHRIKWNAPSMMRVLQWVAIYSS